MAPTGYTDGDGHLEAGLFKSTQGEKQTGFQDYSPLALKKQSKSNKMIYFRRALLVIVMGFVLGLGVATARPSLMNCQRHNDNSKMDLAKAHSSNGELSEALQKASPDMLHRLLHAYLPERYQHGVFATDKDAIDAISERDPSVASAIVQIAKRQDNGPSNNNSTTAAPPTSTAPSSTAVQSSTDIQSSTASSPESTTASETSSSDSSSSTAESTTADSSTSSAPASTTAESTTASEQSTTAAPSSTPSSAPASTTSSASSTSDESVTTGPSSTEASETPQSTITSGSKTTSAPVAHTFTRTLPDGGTTTLTSTSWVAVLPTSHADGSKNPDLQNGASLPRAEMMMPAAIGLLVGAVLLA
ncbi:hypothetical protein TGAMA5MH_08794 [Trichoderma gamsii]|uniref:Uncharacterized protein n=1 Tax=Trichoderma gamsii TaxID=398673 RepID=A0A2K0T1H5_9HYPO|nr:hypothetical protein TGAMA5MH_08794 [Trichoderma gamsii]